MTDPAAGGVPRRLTAPASGWCVVRAAAALLDGRIVSPAEIVLRDGRATAASAREGVPAEAEILDLSEFFVAPFFIDSHVHLELDPGDGLDAAGRADRAADFGLAAVRDGGDKRGRVLRRKDRLSGRCRVLSGGPALHAPGRYGKFIGREVSGRLEVKQAVAEAAEAGADFIKVLASGPVDFTEFGRVGRPQFDREDLAFVVSTAAEAGLGVMAHANGVRAASDCLDAGAASLEHGYFMGEDCLRRLADCGAAWIPTVAPVIALAERETDPRRRSIMEQTAADQLHQAARADDLGVNLVLGTDAGAPGVEVGPSVYREAGLLSAAGLDWRRVLAAATTRPAELAGLAGGLGRLVPTRRARLIALPWTDGRPDFASGPAASAGVEDDRAA